MNISNLFWSRFLNLSSKTYSSLSKYATFLYYDLGFLFSNKILYYCFRKITDIKVKEVLIFTITPFILTGFFFQKMPL